MELLLALDDGPRWPGFAGGPVRDRDMPAFFSENCVGTFCTNECMANDIAVTRMHRRPGASFPGAMGFVPATTNYLDTVLKYHRGLSQLWRRRRSSHKLEDKITLQRQPTRCRQRPEL